MACSVFAFFPICFSLFFRAVIYCLLGALLSGVVASLFRLSLGSLFCFRSCALFVDCFVDFACACFLLCAAVLGVFLLLLAVCACVLASVFACLHVLVECLLACACGFLAGLFVFVGCFCGLLVCLLALLLAAFLANVVPTYKFLVGFCWEIVCDGRMINSRHELVMVLTLILILLGLLTVMLQPCRQR